MVNTDTEHFQMGSNSDYEDKKKEWINKITQAVGNNDMTSVKAIEDEMRKAGLTISFKYASREERESKT